MLMPCKCFRSLVDYDGESDEYCIATKEQDRCFCKGNQIYCDIYPEKRMAAINKLTESNNDVISRRALVKRIIDMSSQNGCIIPNWIMEAIMEDE